MKETSLAIAVRAGRLDAAAALLDLGARIDARSRLGPTALAQAVVTGQSTEMVELLLDAGADPTIVVDCATRCGSSSQDLVGWARTLRNSDIVALLDVVPSQVVV
jgi:ankyrin repeat protein